MGLKPDGIDEPEDAGAVTSSKTDTKTSRAVVADEVVWTWQEVIRTQTFWIICFIYGMANIGIAGLNLHVFASPTLTASSRRRTSIIASTHCGSTLV
jgi:hypothetical protein